MWTHFMNRWDWIRAKKVKTQDKNGLERILNQQVLQSGEGKDFGEAGRENDSLANYVWSIF